MILQQEEPDDYVLATGETYSVREFVELAFAQIGHRIEWRGRGVDEEGIDARGGDVLVAVVRGISGRPRSIGCSSIRQRCGSVWVGVTRSNSPTWCVR